MSGRAVWQTIITNVLTWAVPLMAAGVWNLSITVHDLRRDVAALQQPDHLTERRLTNLSNITIKNTDRVNALEKQAATFAVRIARLEQDDRVKKSALPFKPKPIPDKTTDTRYMIHDRRSLL